MNNSEQFIQLSDANRAIGYIGAIIDTHTLPKSVSYDVLNSMVESIETCLGEYAKLLAEGTK